MRTGFGDETFGAREGFHHLGEEDVKWAAQQLGWMREMAEDALYFHRHPLPLPFISDIVMNIAHRIRLKCNALACLDHKGFNEDDMETLKWNIVNIKGRPTIAGEPGGNIHDFFETLLDKRCQSVLLLCAMCVSARDFLNLQRGGQGDLILWLRKRRNSLTCLWLENPSREVTEMIENVKDHHSRLRRVKKLLSKGFGSKKKI